MNPLIELQAYGQSFWYDNLRRKFLNDGTLQSLIDNDGLHGLTSNPSIFEKAIGQSEDYDEQISQEIEKDRDVERVFEALALADIRAACDMFAHLYESTNGGDGFVSLEVPPDLAGDTEQSISEARRLFNEVGRPNVMIKIPATPEGIPAIRQLIGEGININITLMFSMAHYEAVAQAYLDGLQHLLDNGGDPTKVASVASFFVSRVDSAVDKKLAALDDPAAEALMGKTAIANSKVVYQRFKEIFHGDAFNALRSEGAAVQRLLWASTSTKNPDYPDTMYVAELVGPHTVNTVPENTLMAFGDHGEARGNTIEEDVAGARRVLDELAAVGIDIDDITERRLVDEGVKSFADSFDKLLDQLRKKRDALVAGSAS